MKIIEKYLESITKSIAIFIAISYAFGFLIWNIYLQSLGFYPDLFQGRFILTGTVFILMTGSFLGIIFSTKILLEKIFKKVHLKNYLFFEPKNDLLGAIKFGTIGLVIVFYIFTFSFFIFPTIPGYFGGSKPRLISLIGNKQEISYLRDFNIGVASDVQTGLLCSVYDDSNYIIIILLDRIISLKKDLYKGFVSLPNMDYNKYAEECNTTVIGNLMGWRKLIPNK